MFTGLVETTGQVISLEQRESQARLALKLPFTSELALGDSVAVNGCCLTVSALGEHVFFDLLNQTLKVTSLGQLSPGKIVNLERALAIGDRLGGHFVQGHVDGVGSILDLSPLGQDHRLEVSIPKEIHEFCIEKGSLSIDGISLTIAELKEASAVFWITPHTKISTHLQQSSIGQRVNLEADLLATYTKKLRQSASGSD